jgi:hypothetical protein
VYVCHNKSLTQGMTPCMMIRRMIQRNEEKHLILIPTHGSSLDCAVTGTGESVVEVSLMFVKTGMNSMPSHSSLVFLTFCQ